MANLVKVRTLYDNSIKYYRFDSNEALQKGDIYVGVTRFGNDLVEIHCPSRTSVTENDWQNMLVDLGISGDKKSTRTAYEPIIHYKAKESDISEYFQNAKELNELLVFFKTIAGEYSLEMKILKLHFTHKKEKLVCSYTAEKRVDFRDFVRDMGSRLKIRIEMFQISPKDAITLIDSCGICGRRLCCLTGCNLVRFSSDKKVSYNSKSLGACGKSRCCNFYEIPHDKELVHPEVGGFVCGEDCMYTVVLVSSDEIILRGLDGEIHCSHHEIKKIQDGNLMYFEYLPLPL